MANLRDLVRRIQSVKGTQQITKAMKMVAAAKLQRSQGKMLAARPYARKLTDLMQQLAGKADIEHPLFEVRPVEKRLFVVITSDKGLCGSYNMNVLKLAHKAVDASVAEGVENEATLRSLAEMGCDIAQGYGIAHPLEVDDLIEWVRSVRSGVPVSPPG